MLCAAVPSLFLAMPTYKSGRMCRTESGGAQQPQYVAGDPHPDAGIVDRNRATHGDRCWPGHGRGQRR